VTCCKYVKICIHFNYLFSHLSTFILDLLLTKWVTKVKLDINSVEVNSQLSHRGHPACLYLYIDFDGHNLDQ
jgi:hypothetical protein